MASMSLATGRFPIFANGILFTTKHTKNYARGIFAPLNLAIEQAGQLSRQQVDQYRPRFRL